jgi:hypothetical protein
MKLKNALWGLLALFIPFSGAYCDSIKLDSGSGNYTINYSGADGNNQTVIYTPTNKVSPSVQTQVKAVKNVFNYSYFVSNERASAESIDVFSVPLQSSLGTGTVTNLVGPKNWLSSAGTLPGIGNSVISWSYTIDKMGLAPGKSSDGFTFQASALPGAALAQFSGYAPILGFSDEGPDNSLGLEELINKTEFVTQVVAAPTFFLTTPFNAASTTQALQSHLQTLVQLNQLSPELSKKLGSILISAAANLNGQKREAAKRDLEIFILNLYLDSLKDIFDDHILCRPNEGKKDPSQEISLLAVRLLAFDVKYIIRNIK